MNTPPLTSTAFRTEHASWNPDEHGQQGNGQNDDHLNNHETKQKSGQNLQRTAKKLGNTLLETPMASQTPHPNPELLHIPQRNQALSIALNTLLDPTNYDTKLARQAPGYALKLTRNLPCQNTRAMHQK